MFFIPKCSPRLCDTRHRRLSNQRVRAKDKDSQRQATAWHQTTKRWSDPWVARELSFPRLRVFIWRVTWLSCRKRQPINAFGVLIGANINWQVLQKLTASRRKRKSLSLSPPAKSFWHCVRCCKQAKASERKAAAWLLNWVRCETK